MGFSVSLFVTILWVQGWAEIRVPGQNVDKNTLTTLGIKTLDWQGSDPTNSTQVQMHHNYSKVYNQNENLGQQTQVDEFGQAAVSDEFYSQTSFGGQEQDALNLDDFSQFSDGDDNAFQLQVSSQINQGRDINSLIDKATIQGQKADDLSGVSKNPQTNGGIPQYQTSQDYFSNQYSKSFGQQEELATSASSQRPIYNAHSYGNSQRLDEIMEAEKSQFEEFPEYDQLAEATSNVAHARQVKKFYILDKPIYVHGFKYPPDPDNSLNGNVAVPESEVHSKCPKMVTGQFVYALSCNQFLNCWKGRGHVQNCAPGTLFNPQTLECDFASKVKCLTGPRKPELEQERNLGSLKLKTGCPAGFSGIVPHHSDCSKFINCANGVENVMDCPPGTLFSLKINSCDFPYKAECASWSVAFGGINTYGKYGNANAGINQQQQYSYYQSGNNRYNQNYSSVNELGQYEQSLTNFGNGYGTNSQQYFQGSLTTNKNHYGDQSQQAGSYGSQQQGVDVGEHRQSNYYTGSSNIYGQKQGTFLGGSGGTQNSFGQAQGNTQDYNQYGSTSQSQFASIGNQGSVSCPVGKTGLFPHPHDCSKFLDCAHGRTTVRTCASGTVFDPNINTCSVSYRHICLMFHAPPNQGSSSHKQGQHVSSSSNGNFGQHDLTGSHSQYLHGQQHIQGQSQNQGYYNKYAETTAAKQDAVKCPGDAFGLLPHPYDCSKFLNCAHGKTTVENCGPGTVFNPVSKICDFPHKVDCSSSKSSTNEETLSHGQYVQGQGGLQGNGANAAQWETSQSGSGQGKYYGQSQTSGQSSGGQQQSSNNGETLSHGKYVQSQGSLQGYGANTAQWETSQSGKYYGQSQSSGQSLNKQHTSSNAIVKCPEYASGLYPHPKICSKFLNCANGQTFIQDCGPGTVFNPTSKVCDFPYNVECGVSHGEGLIDIKAVPVSPTPELTIPSGNGQGFQGQNHHGSGGNSQQSSYGQGQVVGWNSNTKQQGQNTGHGSSGTTQQEYYGQGQASGLNVGSQTQGFYEQGNNFLPNSNQQGSYDHSNSNSGGYQQGLYGHAQSAGSSAISKNQQEGGYQQGLYGQTQSTGSFIGKNQQEGGYQQGLYEQTQSTGSSSIGKNQQEGGYQQGLYGQTQSTGSSISKNQQEGGYQQGLYGQTQSTGSSSISKNQQEGGYQQGLYGQTQSTGSSSIGKNQQEGGYQQGLYGQTQSTGSSSISKNQQEGGYQQGLYGQTQSTGSSSISKNQHEGGYQQGLYGQTQSTGSSSIGKNQQEGGYQQELYGQTQSTGSSSISKNQQEGGYQQGLYGQTQSTGSSSISKNQQEGGYQQGLYGQTQSTGSSSISKNQQEGGYQQRLYGQTQSTGGSNSVSKNQHQGFQGQSQQGYYGQGQDQQFDETRNYNQIYGSTSKHNQVVSGSLKPHHTSSPFPSTDVNADYEFGSEDGFPRPGTIKPVTVKPKLQDNRKRKDFCEPLDFHCSVDDCLPLSMVCDGIKDCANGADEQGCDKYLQVFTSTPNSILAVREKDRFLNISLVYCAKSCIESRSFECKSFSYRKDDGACFLSDTNVGYSGALVVSHPYNYYELKASSVNCTGLYKCPSQKCIQHKQLCDGINDCGDRIDEKGCDGKAFGYEIKLGGTDRKHEGRVELKAFGKWGFICDDKFGLRDADVVCKELGFPLGALEVKGNSHYAQDVDDKDVFYLMDDVTCLGNETTVRDCDFNGWGVHNCEAQEVVGVICKTPQETCPKDYWKCDSVQECLPIAFVCDGVFDCTDQSDEGSQHCEAPTELRLAGGSSKYEGRVEIRHHGIWGTVCDDDFNDDAAKVVCKHLGFPGRATAKKDGYFGPGSGSIWLDQVFCQGNESAIQHCVHWNWGEHNCEHGEDVGVICSTNRDDLDVGSERHVQIHQRKKVDDILPEHLFPERCGLRKDDIFLEEDDVHFRVVKGSIARKGDYPWQASLRIKNKSKPAHWCGAVVISQKFVLTAAHCLIGFSKGAYFVVAGDYNTDDVEGTEQEAYIDEFYIHDQFRSGQKMNNDIALVKLKGDGFVFTKDVQPICLPEVDVEYKNGMNCTISGFGTIQSGVSAYSHQMRAGWIPLQSRAVCQMPHVYGTAITDGMICAGSLDEGVDACDGDSGGPLACLHEGFFTLFGLTSWGQHCGHANKPGVYVKVAYYRKWIDDTIRKNS